MSKNTFRKIAAVTLVVCMLFAVCGVAFAESRMITSTGSSFVRDSNTRATATLSAMTSNLDDPHITSTIILQEAPLGSSTFTDSDVEPAVKTSTRATISHVVTFNISRSKEYRVKMVIKDIVGGTTYTNIIYENLR